jgi:Predicted pPIWI-associating nuclease
MDAKGLIGAVENVRKTLRGVKGAQVFSAAVKADVGALASDYFSTFRPAVAAAGAGGEELAKADGLFRELHEMSHKNPTKKRADDVCKDARKALVALEGSRLERGSVPTAVRTSKSDELIISSLKEVCPSAAAAYEQALRDLQGPERLSWRGPATDMREALRETLDALAPDAEVEKMPGYKLEENARRPTMRQKAKYILKNREMVDNQASLSESAVENIENAVSGITRSVYVRSNVSTHTPTSGPEVARLHGWVRLVMCDLLSLPIVD